MVIAATAQLGLAPGLAPGLALLVQPISFGWLEQVGVVNGAVGRLLLACVLGGLVGLERELAKKSAGLRTNLLICLGAAFFTILSGVIAGETGNRGQIASNIVQGIGFLGAGLILHNRNRLSGLASAASVWVVASIGMACGAGLYAPATVAAFIVIVAMVLVGFLEQRVNLKPYFVTYEARGADQLLMLQGILSAVDKQNLHLSDVDTTSIGELQRVIFPLNATKHQHDQLRLQLTTQPGITQILSFRDPEDD
jgi:putative Mg2+ transporter-C (MgtC) family protein